ncbi:MAG: hypothetical protein Pars93KO_23050 [Parasphingorhabdus sp.]
MEDKKKEEEEEETGSTSLWITRVSSSSPALKNEKNIAKRKTICVYLLCLCLWKARYVDAEA